MNELTPIPSAITTITVNVNPGVRRSERNAYRRSCSNVSMSRTPGERARGAAVAGLVPALRAARGRAHRRLVDDASVEELDRALRVAREPRVVRDHADRRALLVQVAQQVHHGLAVRGVEVPGR